MKSITEIKGMPLLQRQQLVVDLRMNVKQSDKDYALAVQLISVATSARDWSEPKLIEVKNVSGHEITIDKTKIAADGTAKIYPWQYVGAARFLEATNPEESEAAFKVHARKAVPGESDKPITTADIVKIVKENSITEDGLARAIARAFKEAGIGAAKAASLIVFLGVLALSLTVGALSAKAQLSGPSYLAGPTSQGYNLQLINTGSNFWNGTLSFTNPITVNYSIATNTTANIVNGTETFTTSYTTNSTTLVPGVISMANYDKGNVSFGYQTVPGGPSSGLATFDQSADGIYWQLSAFSLAAATNAGSGCNAGTNLSIGPGFGPAYIRLNNITFTSASQVATNITAEVGKKASITGP